MPNPVGCPPLFKTPQELADRVRDYFEYIKGEFHIETKIIKEVEVKEKVWDRNSETPSITGLALFLGFESRQSIYDYESRGEFSYTIKRARLRVEASYEQYLLTQASTGAIFALKNFGWKDKTEMDVRGNMHLSDEEIIFE